MGFDPNPVPKWENCGVFGKSLRMTTKKTCEYAQKGAGDPWRGQRGGWDVGGAVERWGSGRHQWSWRTRKRLRN